MSEEIKIKIGDNPVEILTPENGLYKKVFTPTTTDMSIQIFNTSRKYNFISDDYLSGLSLVLGNEVIEYVPNTTAATDLQRMFDDLKELTVAIRDPEGHLETKLKLTREGIFSQFVDNQNNLRTDSAYIAGKILQRAQSSTETSIREMVPGMITQRVESHDFRSIFQQQSNSIVLALQNKGGDLMGIFRQTPGITTLMNQIIRLDGTTLIDQTFIKKALIDTANIETLNVFSAKIANLVARNIDCDQLTVNRANMVRAAFNGISGNVDIDGEGITIRHINGRWTRLDSNGIRTWDGSRLNGHDTLTHVEIIGVEDDFNTGVCHDGKPENAGKWGIRGPWYRYYVPERFRGQKFSAHVSVVNAKTYASPTYRDGDRMLRFVAKVANINYDEGWVDLVGYIHVKLANGNWWNYPVDVMIVIGL